ncbi:Fpg/Nei family DNA glycosylase [Tropheryma whipplei]|uniref:Fpg/Nei family DNA glycosylase n=1 Tax=Tropheryma whipplei TaxID=2039 RepID=UPI0004AF2F23|nr:DNA glycosylase [Tropheryma whipplei]
MPEGHSIHRSAIQFEHNFVGKKIGISSPQGRFSPGARLLDKQRMISAKAYGKQLLLGFENNRFLQVHLGIYGAWQFYGNISCAPTILPGAEGIQSIGAPRRLKGPCITKNSGSTPGASWKDLMFKHQAQARAKLITDTAGVLLSGPAVCKVLTPEEADELISRLGPDPVVNPMGYNRFIKAARKSNLQICKLLMNQSAIAGIGNIYRAEILFRNRVNSFLTSNTIPEDTLKRIWDDWTVLLKCGIKTGQMITMNKAPGHWVYNHHKSPCSVCFHPIDCVNVAGRKLYWCVVCQA